MIVRKSRAIWLTKAVDISVSLLVPVVTYTSPGLRRPPVLLAQKRVIRRGEVAGSALNHRLSLLHIATLYHLLLTAGIIILSLNNQE